MFMSGYIQTHFCSTYFINEGKGNDGKGTLRCLNHCQVTPFNVKEQRL